MAYFSLELIRIHLQVQGETERVRMGCGKSTRGGVVGFSGYVELGDDGQGVGEGECGVKEEVHDGRGGEGEGFRFGAQWTPAGTPAGGHQLGRSRHPLPCGSGQLYN